jgi:DNA-binding CsgD family transcriptional regulator
MLLMFPLGIAYFVFLIVTIATGGSLIWTFVGPVILLVTMFVSRWLGDLEAITSGYVNRTAIRRPPSKLEGVSNFRSRIKVRLVDPATWTGVIYLFAQFPVGIAAFVGLIVSYSVVGSLIFAPLIGVFNDELIHIVSDMGWTYSVDSPVTGLLLTPIGLLGLVLVSHMVLAFSSLHCWWAKLMLGSRSTRVSSRPAPTPTGDEPPRPSTNAEADLSVTDSAVNVEPESATDDLDDSTAKPITDLESPKTAALTPLTPVPFAPTPEVRSQSVPDTAAIKELTTRKQEVFMLMAHGDTNADIAEELFISEGTVKTHVKRIFSKLYMRDRTQLVMFAYEHRLVVAGAVNCAAISTEHRSFGG